MYLFFDASIHENSVFDHIYPLLSLITPHKPHHISFPTFHLLFFNPLSPIRPPNVWMSRAAPGAEEF